MESQLKNIVEAIENPKKNNTVKYALKTFHKNPKFYITSFVWSVVSTVIGLSLFFNQERILNIRKQENFELYKQNLALEKTVKSLRQENNKNALKNYEDIKEINYNLYLVYSRILKLSPGVEKTKLENKFNTVLEYIVSDNLFSAALTLTSLKKELGIKN